MWSYGRQLHNPGLSFAHYYGDSGTVQDLGYPFHCFDGGGTLTLSDKTIRNNETIVRDYLLQLEPEIKQKLFPYNCPDGFGVEVWDFADAIRNNRTPEIDGEEGLRSKALALACYESAQSGKPVQYEDVLSGKISEYQDPINAYWKI
jgi:predicted dehydrogenase